MKPPTLVDVLLAALDEDDGALDALAERLRPALASSLAAAGRHIQAHVEADQWLSAKEAAAHLGISTNALHKLTAERAIPFEQEGPGCKCWFRRQQLDAWRQGENVRSPGRGGGEAQRFREAQRFHEPPTLP